MSDMITRGTQLSNVSLAGDSSGGGAGRQPVARFILRSPLAVASLCYLAILLLAAVAAPVLAPYDPGALDLERVLLGPTAEHLLGTDPLGRDVLSRLMYAGQVSFVNASIAVVTYLLVGVSSGLIAGFLGGWTDRVFAWVVDLLIAIPALIVLLVVISVFGGNVVVAMVALGILGAPGFARVVRAVTLAVRNELYISAAKVIGLPNRHIIAKHVLPQVAGPILVHGSLFCGAALLIDAGLAYLGFAVDPGAPTWGGMIVEASTVMQQQLWLLVPPGVTLGLATLSFALLGDSIRDARAERSARVVVRPSRGKHRVEAEPTPAPSQDAAEGREIPLLEVKSMCVTLSTENGPAAVVENVSLHIGSGETVGLVGESGCGKSILAKSVLGLLPAGGRVAGGSVVFDGINMVTAERRAVRRLRGSEIAMISQEPIASLDPVFTVGQQVGELVRRHHGEGRRASRERMMDLLADVALPDPGQVARRYPHELSGGMAQRVAIAMALAGEPRLLIADEPTTALDVTVQEEILELLRDLQHERGMAILLISHDWGVVAENCRRAYVMYAGHVVESCTVSELFTQPAHPYTVGLLASAPRRTQPGGVIPAIPGRVPSPGYWPRGCHFAPRCYLASVECTEDSVPLVESAPGHLTRCLHHELITA
ncbi:oligopeptide/dipeptide ABC transporter ATP-binding protein [Phytoactinopolyspora limicola]|uniref:oligopeptide/dipeptide ABC transporter ATP-binding protein n=1 Tax=Phytoactinopolyspora limicola TaxID=2715536 RepID=UPI001A9C6C9F